MDYTVNVGGRLLSTTEPLVMGILNVTPDSFFAGSRAREEGEIASRAHALVEQGAAIIDIGGCSTRPGGAMATEAEETERVRKALQVVRRELPEAVVSIDTFRPAVARMAVGEFGPCIINDVSTGQDADMFPTVAALRVPYILMSARANISDMLVEFADKVQQLRDLGQKDIILDPGFGFGKTLEENYTVLREMRKLEVLRLPLLAGLSRKRMVHQLLGTTADEALNGTTVLNTIALLNGADILRVHDVRQAVEAVAITRQLRAGEDNERKCNF